MRAHTQNTYTHTHCTAAVGVMGAHDMGMYAGNGGVDQGGMMGGVGGAQARLYGAASSPRPMGGANGMARGVGGNGVPRSGSSSDMAHGGAGASGGNWVQVMDPEGRVMLINGGNQ